MLNPVLITEEFTGNSFKTPDLNKFISGSNFVCDTIRQDDSEKLPLAKYLSDNDIIPGIKVDTGALPLEKNSSEKLTEGLDGLEHQDLRTTKSLAQNLQNGEQ